jgi:peptidoglycan L-alanyl-D-glutamate endopeptidase CwlK
MTLNQRSLRNLRGVHPELVAVVRRAAELAGDASLGFIVTEGMRTPARQRELLASGASRTMKSRHLTGHAVDLAATLDGQVRWDWPLYRKLADLMKVAANQLGVQIVWGGDWRSFKDGPHFEIDPRAYPQ